MTSLTDATQPAGRVTTYGYDAADQLTAIGYSDSVTPNVAFTYSSDGQRATMADGTGTTSYGYDSRDRLTAQTNGAGRRVGYGYDPASNLTRIDYPTTGQTVGRSYDALNRLTGVSDWLGHTTTFGYDDNSNLAGVAYPTTNGLAATYSHDAANGLTGIVDSAKVGRVQTPFWSYGYTLDGLGQVAAVNDPVQPGAVQHTYGRNALDQLTADARTGTGTGSTSWGYDSAYHTSTRADSTAGSGDTYTVDAAGQLTGLVTKVGAATTRNLTLTYNADGARTGQADSVSGSSASYGYDQADRLTSFTGVGTTASYAYDGDGLRSAKTVNGTATAETWDVAEGLPTLLQDGAARYVDGPGGTPIEQVDGAGTVRFYLADHLGSVRGLTDTSGAITDSYSYDPYGQRTAVTGSAADTLFGYAGQYTDQETGFQYLRARYYDPATGQFLTVDPLVDSTGHPYAYAADNPANFSDPSGLFLGFCDTGLSNCLQTAVNALGSTSWGRSVLATISSFDNTDFANAVYGDATGTLDAAKGIYDGVAFCVRDSSGCKNAAGALAFYIAQHPGDVAALLAKDGSRQFTEIIQEVCAGQYGAAAGHLLVDFATLKGASLFRGLFKAAQDVAILSKLASEAARLVPRGNLSAQVWGTLVHSQLERLVKGLHRTDIRTEVRYLNGVPIRGARIKGEVRLDIVVYDKSGKIVQVFDLKTGAEGLTPKRISQIQAHLPAGSQTAPITEIRP